MNSVEMFKTVVIDAVVERIEIERRAGCPQGLTNRPFEAITGELIMANWANLARRPVQQVVLELCGITKPRKAPRKRRGNR